MFHQRKRRDPAPVFCIIAIAVIFCCQQREKLLEQKRGDAL